MTRPVRARRLLSDEIGKDRAKARAELNRSPFFGTGVHPNGNQGLDSDNYVTGVSGFSLNGGTGVAEFKDIVLYDLPNSMLASPITPSVVHNDAAGFNVTTSWATVSSITIPVPAGYTRAMVTAIASASAYNPTGSSDYLYASARIQSDIDIGYAMPVTTEPGASRNTTQAATALLTSLSGSFNVWVKVKSQVGNWTTSTSGNVANIDATVVFLR